MKVDILNGKGESVNKLPGSDKDGDKVITNHVCQHGGKSWPYWFRKMENITLLGPHTLQLQVLLSDSSTAPSIKSLPVHRIKFTVTEASPNKFTVGMLETPLRVGVPFQIPLNLLDEFNNPSKLSEEKAPVLSASGLELTHQGTSVKGNSLIVKGLVALGSVPSHAGKDFNLKITLPGLEEGSQSLKIRLLPGPPESLAVTPNDSEVTIENNSALQLQVQRPVIDEPMAITKPAVPCAQLLCLGSTQFISNNYLMYNNKLTRFVRSFSNTPKSRK
ncbi:unnamed protein product [Porites evermanni]|uniref:Uncharacterized protein n=1 Tax=Porites evermanni TaxID=104178 RepID=A0ABN8RYL6_9CNID|nr:unnamed protein product [Porites evermanni]